MVTVGLHDHSVANRELGLIYVIVDLYTVPVDVLKSQ